MLPTGSMVGEQTARLAGPVKHRLHGCQVPPGLLYLGELLLMTSNQTTRLLRLSGQLLRLDERVK